MRIPGALILMAALTISAIAQDTLKSGDAITGQLRVVTVKHPNGTPIRAWQIVADKPKPFAKKDEFCGDKPPKVFHLILSNNPEQMKRLRRRIGKTIAIEAEDFFCSQTAWHIGDAVVAQWRFKD